MASSLFTALLSAALPVVTRALVTKHIFHVAAQESTTLSYHDTAVSIHLMNHHDKSAELNKSFDAPGNKNLKHFDVEHTDTLAIGPARSAIAAFARALALPRHVPRSSFRSRST